MDEFIRYGDELVEYVDYFSKLPEEEFTVHSLKIEREELKALWEVFRSLYNELTLEQIQKSDDKTEKAKPSASTAPLITSIKVKHRAVYKVYVKCLSKIDSAMEALVNLHSSKNSSGVAPATATTSSSIVKLRPLETGIFDGNYLTWPSFRNMFTVLVRNNTSLTSIEKLTHLQNNTRGEALDIVKRAPISNEGFVIAWDNLVARYDNKRILVNNQLKALLNLTPIEKEFGASLNELQRTINDCLHTLKSLDIDIKGWDPIIVYMCSTHLPMNTLALWEQSIDSKLDIPTWDELNFFLTSRYQTLEAISDIRGPLPQSKINKKGNNQPNGKVKMYHNQTNSVKCLLCKDGHQTRSCPTLTTMSIDERYSILKKHKLCTNCLASSHHISRCPSKFSCISCGRRHHSILHRGNSYSPPSNNPNNKERPHTSAPQNVSSGIESTNSVHNTEPNTSRVFTTMTDSDEVNTKIVLGTARVNLKIGDIVHTTRALIDPASEATFISERLQQTLKLQTATLRDNALVVKKLIGSLPSCAISTFIHTHWNDLTLADNNFKSNAKVDLLIGSNLYGKILRKGVRISPNGQLVAQQTIFGWIVTGVAEYPKPNPSVVSFFNSAQLEGQLMKFWELEEPSKEYVQSNGDKYCEELFKASTYRNEDGRYVVALPFKQTVENTISLGQSRSIALSQFKRNEMRLSKNLEQKQQYDSVIEEYLTLGHMTPSSVGREEPFHSAYYLPHHAVIKPHSTTTKLRVVFNASSPSSNGNSLNDLLHPGPTLQSDLTTLILKWRLYRYVFNADMEKMYRQILVNPNHTSFQRILFRSSPYDEIRDFELKTVTFGVNCAPYLAIRTLHQLADENITKHPAASYILKNSMYVDDVLAGGHTLEEANKSKCDLILVLKSAGFVLRKWTANDKKLLSNISPNDLLDSQFLEISEKSITKTLGLKWNAGTDIFCFDPVVINPTISFTKRKVLSEIAKLFDPAGWLAPKIVVAKILMQQVWIDKTQWDESLHPLTLKRWYNFIADYEELKNIKIPRWVNFKPQDRIELHGFSDASERSYAAALYLRTIDHSGNIFVNLLTAKTKVSPIIQKSIPKLELCGAELLAKLASNVRTQLDMKTCPLFLYTDSSIVLAWLKKPPFHWQTFVANRVSLIQEKVGTKNWKHVESQDNPADIASRGTTLKDLKNFELWWKGPKWLSSLNYEGFWENGSEIFETTLEAKSVKVHVTTTEKHNDILDRFSCMSRALRILCHVFRFFYKTHPRYRLQEFITTDQISSSELQNVQCRLICITQREYFYPEYQCLLKKVPLHKKSTLLTLNPFIDSQGLMRINGRIVKSTSLSYNEKFPVLLPYSSRFTLLFVEFIHRISVHGENYLMMRLIRTMYWIPKARNIVRTVINCCKICVIMKHKRTQQIMAALPPERCSFTRPFTHTGVDFAGPFDIKTLVGRGCRISKGYVLVFVCFATKAIHLEATSDMSTPVFLAAFTRFFSRRGCPAVVYSDNGTSFVGASKVIAQDFVKSLRNNVLASPLCAHITWKFIPPGAPHMGGLWEAGVKSFKSHFKKVAHNSRYTLEEFSTLLTKIEACLNSRPISPMSEDPSDAVALTPGHFLIGSPMLAPPEPELLAQSISLMNRWQKVTRLHQELVLRWKEEYLKEMHRRYKWQYPERDVAEGDLVVVRQENLPSTQWRLGRIQKVYHGDDSRVRVADVITYKGVITRPVVKLVVLPSAQN